MKLHNLANSAESHTTTPSLLKHLGNADTDALNEQHAPYVYANYLPKKRHVSIPAGCTQIQKNALVYITPQAPMAGPSTNKNKRTNEAHTKLRKASTN